MFHVVVLRLICRLQDSKTTAVQSYRRSNGQFIKGRTTVAERCHQSMTQKELGFSFSSGYLRVFSKNEHQKPVHETLTL